MKWNVLAKESKDILKTLLKNRAVTDEKDFLNPPPPEFKLDSKKAIARIKKAIKEKENIVVYGDYDADGICATAIMWEALHNLGANALPFIPLREDEGYGLSIEGIKKITASLIIVVDSGIVAHEAVKFAKTRGIDVIILDHHEKGRKLPPALAIIHTEKLCASGIGYFLAKELAGKASLELAAIATITDLMTLTGVNRSIVKYGLAALNKTTRPGLKALLDVAGIKFVGVYEVGFMIGPRLNASGRIENALSALRLLCTKNPSQARQLAELLNKTNKDRQDLLADQTAFALQNTRVEEKIILAESETYHQGVIGLIAGKLVERYYLPAIVISRGEIISKASARSISGFNIIEAIRRSEKILVSAGGHPMAAGFTIETNKISSFKLLISKYAKEKITDGMLEKTLSVDLEIPINLINLELYKLLAQLAPFGMGNPEPIFASKVTVQNLRTVGVDGKHLKLVADSFDAIAFNQGRLASKIKSGQKVDIAYTLSIDSYNGKNTLQLKIKDIHYE